jgi:RHH-type rel operon transcriptional repressor/antitoxin RelB
MNHRNFSGGFFVLVLTSRRIFAMLDIHVCLRRRAMATKMFAVRVDDDLEQRFKTLARETGRTATYYVREAMERHIADLEEQYAASRVLARVRNGEESVIDFEEWEADYDAKMAGAAVDNSKAAVGRSRSGGRRAHSKVRA